MSALGAEHLRCRLLLTVRFAVVLRLVVLRLVVRFAVVFLFLVAVLRRVVRVVQHVVVVVVLRLRLFATTLRLRLLGAGLHTVTVVHLRRAGLRLTTAFLALLRL